MTVWDFMHQHPVAPYVLGLLYLVTAGSVLVLGAYVADTRAPRNTRSNEQRPWP